MRIDWSKRMGPTLFGFLSVFMAYLALGTNPVLAAGLAGAQIVERVSPSVALVLVGEGQGRLARSGSALVVREDGVLLTAYHLIKGARQVQVRLHNGETYDQVRLVGVDERRDVAVIRIPASGLKVLPVASADEAEVGDAVFVISNPVLLGWTASDGILSGARLADDISGAGTGYRLLQFTAPVSP
ncbi:MAG: S1C family serine protease, partial [Terriglobia bacterium]